MGAEGLCYGITDLPPGPELEADAERISTQMPKVARIVTSPLMRARRLAEAIAARTGLELVIEAKLVEMNFGTWEGRPWSKIPREELDAWAADLMHACPHGGESVAQMSDRVTDALAHCDGSLVVTHMGVIKAALAMVGHTNAWEAQVGFGEIVQIDDI